ncbi:MAG: DUF2490 domain-containing protein [Niabella sp.]
MTKKILVLLVLLLSLFHWVNAQTSREQTGWFFFLNSTKLNDKWGLHLDVQVRSHDNWNGIRNVLVRPGLTYFIRSNQNATAGYLYVPTLPVNGATLIEHRIWEQYIISHKAFTGSLSHRFRLEQRFIEKTNNDRVFAQRFRYFFRHIQPLSKTESTFVKGPFAALQNEVFFNIQNKENTNNRFFDQNRSYLAGGYRFSKKLDIEAGYMNVFGKGAAIDNVNNVAQLAIYTRF